MTSVVLRLSSACLLFAGLQVNAQQPTAGNRHDAAAAAFARGLMPLHSSRVDRFAADHPEWDGRGVLIAILFVLPRGIVPSLAQRLAKRSSKTGGVEPVAFPERSAKEHA